MRLCGPFVPICAAVRRLCGSLCGRRAMSRRPGRGPDRTIRTVVRTVSRREKSAPSAHFKGHRTKRTVVRTMSGRETRKKSGTSVPLLALSLAQFSFYRGRKLCGQRGPRNIDETRVHGRAAQSSHSFLCGRTTWTWSNSMTWIWSGPTDAAQAAQRWYSNVCPNRCRRVSVSPASCSLAPLRLLAACSSPAPSGSSPRTCRETPSRA
jgi:hypothetical protein